MKNSSVELRQLQALKRNEGSDLVAKAELEGRELTAVELTTLRSIETDVTAFDAQIKDAELREKFAKSNVEGRKTAEGDSKEKREIANFSFGKLVRELSLSRGDENAITGLEKEMLQESAKEKRALGSMGDGLYLSNKFLTVENRTMSAGSSTAGGNFIATDKVGSVSYTHLTLPTKRIV